MEAMIKFFKSLGDQTRLRIFYLLLHYNGLSVGDIEKIINTSQTNVSRHLAILKNAGIVDSRRSGTYMIYQLKPDLEQAFKLEFKKMASEYIQFQSDINNAQKLFLLTSQNN